MDLILTWLAAGAGTLFTVAVAVAWWEHLQRNGPREAARAVLSRPPVASVDLHVDDWVLADTRGPTGPGGDGPAAGLPGSDAATLSGADAAAGRAGSDTGTRQAALDSAMNRMARPAPWLDTRPTVLTSTAPAPAQGSLRLGARPGDLPDIDDAADATLADDVASGDPVVDFESEPADSPMTSQAADRRIKA